MEKVCEFCTASRPVVYCKADAARLCLICDSKVHSANEVSGRHMRTLLCDYCRCRPCYLRCLDHRLFLCRGCDSSMHIGISARHQRRPMSTYTGCPSAKSFASMWGFRWHDERSFSQLGVSSTRTDGDSINEFCQQLKMEQRCLKSSDGEFPRENCLIFQQILELNTVQLGEENGGLIFIRQGEETHVSSSRCSFANDNDEILIQGPIQSKTPRYDLSKSKDPNELIVASPFSQMVDASSSTLGDTFWQCKTPTQYDELWSQNMQDIGSCEDRVSHDDFDIPDIDLTFRNFDELFRSEEDPMVTSLSDNQLSGLWKDNDNVSVCGLFNKAAEHISVASSTCFNRFAQRKTKDSPCIKYPASPQGLETAESTVSEWPARSAPPALACNPHYPGMFCWEGEKEHRRSMKRKRTPRRLYYSFFSFITAIASII